jgi:hypothetical protein
VSGTVTMCHGSRVRTISLRVQNHANNLRIWIRNQQSVLVAESSIARLIVGYWYTRGPKVSESGSVPIVLLIWNRANKFVSVEHGALTLNVQ